ncbi:MAG: PASTA domain-containing protein, partial [Candidatus Vogelbacteria bacterium]|nr:PASTA domain-containing protein [Candidatus Vogelbacteria bacterium]
YTQLLPDGSYVVYPPIQLALAEEKADGSIDKCSGCDTALPVGLVLGGGIVGASVPMILEALDNKIRLVIPMGNEWLVTCFVQVSTDDGPFSETLTGAAFDKQVTGTVPEMTGLTQAEAVAEIETTCLVVGTITTETNTTVPAGRVISWTPRGDQPCGTAINLVVSSGTGAELTGVSFTNPSGNSITLNVGEILHAEVSVAGVGQASLVMVAPTGDVYRQEIALPADVTHGFVMDVAGTGLLTVRVTQGSRSLEDTVSVIVKALPTGEGEGEGEGEPKSFLTVNLQPAGAIVAGAQWQVLDIVGSFWQASGARVSVPAGGHAVVFSAVEGFNSPPTVSVNVGTGETVVSGVYTKITTGEGEGEGEGEASRLDGVSFVSPSSNSITLNVGEILQAEVAVEGVGQASLVMTSPLGDVYRQSVTLPATIQHNFELAVTGSGLLTVLATQGTQVKEDSVSVVVKALPTGEGEGEGEVTELGVSFVAPSPTSGAVLAVGSYQVAVQVVGSTAEAAVVLVSPEGDVFRQVVIPPAKVSHTFELSSLGAGMFSSRVTQNGAVVEKTITVTVR